MSVLNWTGRIERSSLPVSGSKRAFPFATATSHAILSPSFAGPLTGLSNVVAYVCRLSREEARCSCSVIASGKRAASRRLGRPPSAYATHPDRPLRSLCAVSPISGGPIRYERIPDRSGPHLRNIVSCHFPASCEGEPHLTLPALTRGPPASPPTSWAERASVARRKDAKATPPPSLSAWRVPRRSAPRSTPRPSGAGRRPRTAPARWG
jgi:hypothetical protein